MIGGPAAAQIVVVHARQIVVHERVGVDALDRTGRGQGAIAGAAACFGGREGEHGTQPLSTGEKAVTHGLVQRRWPGRGAREEALQGAIDEGGSFVEVTLEIHAGGVVSANAAGAVR